MSFRALFTRIATSLLGGAIGLSLSASMASAQIATGNTALNGTAAPSGASADYRVGAGDLLAISVYRSPDLQTNVRVGTDGTIGFPSLGELQVANKTANEISDLLAGQLKQRGILISPSVNVLVSEVRARTVMVMGSVARPGEVPLDRPGMTLATVLARSGATFGTGAAVVTVMENKTDQAPREQFRMSDLVSGTSDREARPGEILVVESAPTIYVSGEVGRPGAYPLEPGMTVGQALAVGGGVTPRGSAGRIRLTRTPPGGKPQTTDSIKFDAPLMPGDLVYVRQRLF